MHSRLVEISVTILKIYSKIYTFYCGFVEHFQNVNNITKTEVQIKTTITQINVAIEPNFYQLGVVVVAIMLATVSLLPCSLWSRPSMGERQISLNSSGYDEPKSGGLFSIGNMKNHGSGHKGHNFWAHRSRLNSAMFAFFPPEATICGGTRLTISASQEYMRSLW